MSSFRNGLPKDRIPITFDTRYRSSGTITQPIFTFNEPLNRVGKAKIDRVELYCSYFVLNSGNNVLGSNIGGGTITVAAGTYTPSSLASALQTAIRATGGGFSAATVTYSSITFKYTISSGSVSTFTIDSDSTLAEILGFSSDKTAITTATSDFSVYESNIVLVADNRVFVINQSGTDYTFTIPTGNYTGSNLATAVQTQILLQLSNFTVTFSSITYTFTISHTTTAFTFKGLSSSAASILGIPTNVASTSLSVISTQPALFIGPTSMLIKSRAITQYRQTVVLPNVVYTDSIFELSLNGLPGDVIYSDPEDANEIFMSAVGGANFSSIDFRVTDDTGVLINLGLIGRWKIYMVFETY